VNRCHLCFSWKLFTIDMNKKNEIAIILGLVLNVIGYIAGSNIIMTILPESFNISTLSEREVYTYWNICGSISAWAGNVLCVALISHQNVIRTIIGSIVGLTISILLSFVPMPMFFILGMASIFICTYFGQRGLKYAGGSVTSERTRAEE